jgi:hypothetical protein
MEQTELFQKFSQLIENKINKRNKEAINLPKNENLIKYFDNELDILESMERYVADLIYKNSQEKAKVKINWFCKGIEAGIMECKTGRPHPEYLFR